MGSSGSVNNQETASPQDIIEYLNELFAYALSLGMTYEQYWYDEPKLINAYIKAEEMRISKRNQELWLQGLYNHIALNTSLSNAFSKHSHAKYIEKPFALTKREQEEEENRRVQQVFDYLNARSKK